MKTVDDALISRAVEMLRESARPRKIILFGSHATGKARRESDVDLLVIEDEVTDVLGEMVRLRRVLSPLRIPVDVLIVSLQHFKEWCDTPGNVFYEAAAEGKVLYEAS